MTIGDIYWVELVPRGGHAQAGRRPAVVLQTATASAALPTVILVPLTTQQDALRFPGTVLVETDPENGLRLLSVALVFQITATDASFLRGKIGRISEAVLEDIQAALDDLTGR